MPPRYAYWTILIDKGPTAFRARDKDDLLPTLNQLRRTNKDVELKWFARGRLWDSPEQEQLAARMPVVKRPRDWRPGGNHKDPRERFKTRGPRRDHRPAKDHGQRRGGPPPKDFGPRRDGPPKDRAPWRDRPPTQNRGPRPDRPPAKDFGPRRGGGPPKGRGRR